jgi:hypothetical protein
MFVRHATAPSPRVCEQALASAWPLVSARAAFMSAWEALGTAGAIRAVGAAVAMAPLAAGCGAPNPRILDATEEARGMPSAELGSVTNEQEKIEALLTAVRRSEHTFVHEGIERNGAATAQKLQLLLERDPTGVRSAREFIDRIAAPDRGQDSPDRLLLGHDDYVLASHWYNVRLAQLEGRPPPPDPPERVKQAQVHARRLLILDALNVVEHSELRFVAPPRKAAAPKPNASRAKPSTGPKRKPKRKEYTGVQFAEMLRTKWEFLGADIEDLDTFIDEIASDSFASMVPYRVVLDDGREEDFGRWLRAQLATEQAKVAQGGAP